MNQAKSAPAEPLNPEQSRLRGAAEGSKQATTGDAAVDGLLAGVGAGLAMVTFIAALGVLGGQDVAALLSSFDPNAQSPVTGALIHLAVSGVYGVIFGIARRASPLGRAPAWFAALAYAFALLALAETVLLRGVNESALLAIPFWLFAAAHVVYGLTLAWLIGKAEHAG